MSSKLENSLAQLFKLKNQLRLQLNQIRPYHEPIYSRQKQSKKKLFTSHNQSISTFSTSKRDKISRKRLYQEKYIFPSQYNHPLQKRHYRRHYTQTSITTLPIRLTSSYLNIKTQRNVQSGYGNSLVGIGEKSKMTDRPSTGIKIHPEKHIYKGGLI